MVLLGLIPTHSLLRGSKKKDLRKSLVRWCQIQPEGHPKVEWNTPTKPHKPNKLIATHLNQQDKELPPFESDLCQELCSCHCQMGPPAQPPDYRGCPDSGPSGSSPDNQDRSALNWSAQIHVRTGCKADAPIYGWDWPLLTF